MTIELISDVWENIIRQLSQSQQRSLEWSRYTNLYIEDIDPLKLYKHLYHQTLYMNHLIAPKMTLTANLCTVDQRVMKISTRGCPFPPVDQIILTETFKADGSDFYAKVVARYGNDSRPPSVSKILRRKGFDQVSQEEYNIARST